jgi:uncharacterized circularly permuted ATP-grasp superfamily protein
MTSDSIKRVMTMSRYVPNLAYIGRKKFEVPNYLFSTVAGAHEYSHCTPIVTLLKHRSVRTELRNAKLLTQHMFRLGLSFSKHEISGDKEFSVSCNPIVIPIPNSTFARLDEGAARLTMALRLIMQDIYGSAKPEDASFVRNLPRMLRTAFLSSIRNSPYYMPQLHHPDMRNYPFFDVVGLDLVLTGDMEISEANVNEFPFRLLEINAGSPSGAANNQHLLEILEKIDPEMIAQAGKILPNNHFEVMASVYHSLGREWTGRDDGIAVILAPGGQSGAAPEIHELARRSGLLYCEASEFFLDNEGYLRVHDIHSKNPIVTSIYSRVNADSALFSPPNKILLRDFESGATLWSNDPLVGPKHAKLLREKAPLQSMHAIPNLLESVLSHRVYMGGLNRLLDDKCILQTVCLHGPKFFSRELHEAGISIDSKNWLLPPLSPKTPKESIAAVRKNSHDWVIKSPHLSGGSGVHILRCLSFKKRRMVVRNFVKHPKRYALQRLVFMGHIPAPVKSGNQLRYANLAADLRMWAFYGAGAHHPRPTLTRNALMRTAPAEKGPMSSIVNTSKGGGYAPVAVVETNMVKKADSSSQRPQIIDGRLQILPLMSAAKILQTARICNELKNTLKHDRSMGKVLYLSDELRSQVREISCFLSSDSVARVQDIHLWKTRFVKAFVKKPVSSRERRSKRNISDWLINHRSQIKKKTLDEIDESYFRIGNQPRHWAVRRTIRRSESEFVLEILKKFERETARHLNASRFTEPLAKAFCGGFSHKQFRYQALVPEGDSAENNIATLWEYKTGTKLAESERVPKHLRDARAAWSQIETKGRSISPSERSRYFTEMRAEHFARYPALYELQRLVDKGSTDTIEELLAALQLAPYSRFCLESYAQRHGVSEREMISRAIDLARTSKQARNREETLFNGQLFMGETTLKKSTIHERVSRSEVAIWVSSQQSPFCAANTLGHELIHVAQFEELQRLERHYLEKGPLDAAIFANLYATLFDVDFSSAEMEGIDRRAGRQHIFGFGAASMKRCQWADSMLRSAKKGAREWNQRLAEYGNWISYDTSPLNSDRIKACREVLASIENAKNIRFTKSLGLLCSIDEIATATPFADDCYRRIFRRTISSVIDSTSLNWRALRIIANAQLPGVYFRRAERLRDWPIVQASLGSISLGGVAAQSQ